MSQKAETQAHHSWELTVDADWVKTVAMAALLAICVLSLIVAIRHSIHGNLEPPFYRHTLFVNIFIAVAAFYCLLFARATQMIAMKVGCVLMAADLAGDVVRQYIHGSSAAHAFGIVASVLHQIALVCLAAGIVEWFKSVVCWTPTSSSEDIGSLP